MQTRYFFLFVLLISFGCSSQKETATTQSEAPKVRGTLYYVYDPLCGWCYGFSPVIDKLEQAYRDEITVEVVSGGMITGDRVGPIGEVAPYIKSAYKDVEKRTGIVFGTPFLTNVLEEGSTVFSSLEPSIALEMVRDRVPERALAFAKVLQEAIYADGIAPTDFAALAKLAVDFGWTEKEFLAAATSEKYTALAEANFVKADQLGAQGFPTIVYKNELGTLTTIAVGYLNYEQIEKALLREL